MPPPPQGGTSAAEKMNLKKLLKFYVKHFPINSLLEIYFDKD